MQQIQKKSKIFAEFKRFTNCFSLKALLVTLFLLFVGQSSLQAWGFWAHKRINRIAVFTLPPELIHFYKLHLEYITEHAVDPDKRRYAVEGEDKKHYIDIDYYGEYPFEALPRKWEDAIAKFSEDTVRTYGILPWELQRMLGRLTKAFEEENIKKILKYSADFGHYIADGHVPLHTTLNYNGQMTGQKGIHGFWESRVPELLGDDYDYFVGKARYVDEPATNFWSFILESAAAVDSVLNYEKLLTEEFPTDQKYSYEARGELTIRVYSAEFTRSYSKMLNNMIERKMRKAIIAVGSFWMTAWVNAGQPDLSGLGVYTPSEKDIKEQEELDRQHQSGEIKGRMPCD